MCWSRLTVTATASSMGSSGEGGCMVCVCMLCMHTVRGHTDSSAHMNWTCPYVRM